MALSKYVKVYNVETGRKYPHPVPRSHLPFNPALRVVPSQRSKEVALHLDSDDYAPPAHVVAARTDDGPTDTPPSEGQQAQSNTTIDPTSGSEQEKE